MDPGVHEAVVQPRDANDRVLFGTDNRVDPVLAAELEQPLGEAITSRMGEMAARVARPTRDGHARPGDRPKRPTRRRGHGPRQGPCGSGHRSPGCGLARPQHRTRPPTASSPGAPPDDRSESGTAVGTWYVRTNTMRRTKAKLKVDAQGLQIDPERVYVLPLGASVGDWAAPTGTRLRGNHRLVQDCGSCGSRTASMTSSWHGSETSGSIRSRASDSWPTTPPASRAVLDDQVSSGLDRHLVRTASDGKLRA